MPFTSCSVFGGMLRFKRAIGRREFDVDDEEHGIAAVLVVECGLLGAVARGDLTGDLDDLSDEE